MRTLPQLIRESLEPARDACLAERAGGAWTTVSSSQLLERVETLSRAIRAAGLQQGDRVALIAADCVDWIVCDFAVLFAGCVVVPVFPTQAPDQVRYILENSQARLIFCDTPAAAVRLRELDVALPPVVVFQSSQSDSLATFEALGKSAAPFSVNVDPHEMAVLIYTSGTTGEPKGVMLSHGNLVSDVIATFTQAFNTLQPGVRTISVLPFSHIYEHCVIYGYLYSRVQHYICHSVEELLTDLKEVKPVVMTSVPRIFERVLAGITAKAKNHGGAQAKLVPWALATGREYMTARVRGKRINPLLAMKYRVASALVLRKIRPALGLDELKFFCSGSAPLHFDTAMTMLGAGIPIVEGYGPTECSPVITANTFEDNHYGTVGRPIPGVQVKIASDGEILARGPNVMLGYYLNEAATAEVIEDGWYHTGDIGEVDGEGFLRITDRKKELFKTSGGKFIAPARVEAAIKRSVYINQVMLVGNARPHPTALVSPSWDLVRTECGIASDVAPGAIAARPDVLAFLTKEVRDHTADLAKFEQVWKIAILPHELTVEDGDLSPTLKVRRRVVESKYASLIESLYEDTSKSAIPA